MASVARIDFGTAADDAWIEIARVDDYDGLGALVAVACSTRRYQVWSSCADVSLATGNVVEDVIETLQWVNETTKALSTRGQVVSWAWVGKDRGRLLLADATLTAPRPIKAGVLKVRVRRMVDHWLTSPGTCRGRFWLPQDRIFTGPREHYRLELGYLRIEATVIGEPPTPRYTLEDPSGYGGLEGDGREWRAYPVEYRYRVDVETSLTNLRYEAPTLPADFVLGRMFYKRRCYNRTYGVWPGITTEKSVPYDCGKCSSGVDMVTREAALDLDTSWIANPVVSGPYDGNIYSESIEFKRKITCDFKRYFWSEEPRDQAEYDYAIDNTQHPVWLPFWWCLMLNLYEGAELRIDNPRIKVKLLWDFMQTHPDNLPVED